MSRTIKAFSEAQIWAHKHLVHFVAVFVVTGLPLISRDWFWWVAVVLGSPLEALGVGGDLVTVGLQVARWLHRLAALGLAVILVPYVVAELSRVSKWQILPECWTLSCLARAVKALVDYYLRKRSVAFGKYNLGQKLWAWAVIVGLPLMYVTGLIMWFRDLFSVDIQRWAHLLHDIGFFLAVILLSIHVYCALLPEHRPSLRAMFRTGELPEEYVRQHHPLWYEKLQERAKEGSNTASVQGVEPIRALESGQARED